MKTIGMLGGMSWESTLEYYRILNEETKRLLGNTHSAECLMYAFDFDEVERLQHENSWEELTQLMVEKSLNLKKGGADFLLICTNTMHVVASAIEKTAGLKVLHIADATGRRIVKKGFKKVALLGTKFTMEGSFYKDILKNKYGVDVIIPKDEDRNIIHRVIYDELVKGQFLDESREEFIQIINKLVESGAQAIVLGCTEIPLLIKEEHVGVPVFDTLTIHAKDAVSYAINNLIEEF